MSVLNLARAMVAELDRRVSHGTVPSSVPWDSGTHHGTNGANGTVGTPGATGSEILPDAPPCPATIAERAAIIAEGDHCHRATADARALAEYGLPSWPALADAHRERILGQLARLPPASGDDGRHLLRLTRAFLETQHWQAAVALGWGPVELFGIHAHAPATRIDGQGLITGLALSKLSGGHLETITEMEATIRYRSGSLLTWRRDASGLDAAVLWWESPAIIGVVGTELAGGAR